MDNILMKIYKSTFERVRKQKEQISLKAMIDLAESFEIDYKFPFEKALLSRDITFICEIKRASPSKGIICRDFPYKDIAREYELAGAGAISVLTENSYFMGRDEYLSEITEIVALPVLRKDFIIDEYQIYQAKVLGASAVLLICALLDEKKLEKFINTTHRLGMSALAETHTEQEIKSAIGSGARIIGVNNRNLKTFNVDVQTSVMLSQFIPDDIIFVSESGISSSSEIEILKNAGADAVLIGESIMKSNNKKQFLSYLSGN